MTASETHHASSRFLVGIYTVIYIMMAAAYLLINYFIKIDNAAIAIIIAAAAAMTMARNWVLREQATPSGKRIWMISLACALVTTVLLGFITILGVAANEQLLREAQHEGPMLIVGVAAVLLVINLIVIRLGLWTGIWQAAKLVR
jgi:lysylphosphatidylglycerol synthetase-like protein (DUF2156 family)